MRTVVAVSAALLIALYLPPSHLSTERDNAFWPAVLTDRTGQEMRFLREAGTGRARWVPLAEMAQVVIAATLAGEDQRFRSHPGVDPLAVLRAGWQFLKEGRIVSGASTLTMQLSRLESPHPRNALGKLWEMGQALRLERWTTKDQILEAYLNRVYYGHQAYGIEAAARTYFARPASQLSLAQAAFLAVVPRSPEALDPYEHAGRALARRDVLLTAMVKGGFADREEADRARVEPLGLRRPMPPFEAPHFVDHLLAREGPLPASGWVQTTLDLALQRDLELLVLRHLQRLAGRGVGQAAVVVLEVTTGEVLAMVGSAAYDDPEEGQVNGATSLRQPGSALKPFIYALALEGKVTPATLLPDLPVHFATFKGDYVPENYSRDFRGPVRLREALASSLNVPAVRLMETVGVERALRRLQDMGLSSLHRSPEHYGLALTLGDGEVRLVDLANAYRALALGGMWNPVKRVRSLKDREGRSLALPPSQSSRRVLAPKAAYWVTDILADPAARVPAFGRHSVLDLPFPCAVKTGTSRSYRDNWAVGFTSEVVVGVWAGNFDGSPMGEVTGVTGAGPLFREAMLRAMQGREARPFPRPQGLQKKQVCSLSGEAAGTHCPGRVEEWLNPGTALPVCSWHRPLSIDRRNGLLAGPGCPLSQVVTQVLPILPTEYLSWASQTEFPSAPSQSSPLCPGGLVERVAGQGPPVLAPRGILHPAPGSTFALDDEVPASSQALTLTASAPPGTVAVSWEVDGVEVARPGPPFSARWPLKAGAHRVGMVALGREGQVLYRQTAAIQVEGGPW